MTTSYYLLLRKQDARDYYHCGSMDCIHEWLQYCKEPLFCFEGIATDEVFEPEGYELIRVTDNEQWKAIHKKFYSIQKQ